MADDDAVCRSCGASWTEGKPAGETVSAASLRATASTPIMKAEEKPTLRRGSVESQIEKIAYGVRDSWKQLQKILSMRIHGTYFVDGVLIVLVSVFFMWSAIVAQLSTFGGDNISYFIFLNRLLRDSLLQFNQIPLWNPYYFSGMPYVANPQTSPFYVSSLFILVFGEGDGTRWSVILHVILSGLNMYYLLMSLGQRRLGALLSAIGYMFSGYIIAGIAIGHITFVYAYAWAPLAFAFSRMAVGTGRLRYAAFAGVVLMLQLQSGGLIVLGYTSILIALYLLGCSVLWYWHNRKLLSSGPILKFGSVALVIVLTFSMLSAAKLIPFVEFVLQTSRIGERGGLSGGVPNAYGLYSSLFQKNAVYYNSLQGYGWWEYSAYVGLLIFPAIAAIFLTWPKKNRALFFVAMIALSVIFGMGVYSPLSSIVILAYNYVPLFSALLHLPARFLFLTVFSISVLSGTAVSSLLDRATRFRRKAAVRLSYVLVSGFLFIIILDMGFFAASNFGTVSVPSSVGPYTTLAPHDLSVSWLQYPANSTARTGEAFTISVLAKNVGDTIWLRGGQSKGSVNLGIFVGDAEFRFPLPTDTAPGEEVSLNETIPGRPDGNYRVTINFVDELVGWFNPPYPTGNLTVSSSPEPSTSLLTVPIDSYSETHALIWLSQQNHSEYFRFGPYSTVEGDLYEAQRMGLYSVGGYETEGILLPAYERFVSVPSFKTLGLLSMKYVVLNNQTSVSDLVLVYKAAPWFVYENKHYLPMAYSIEHAILMIGSDSDVFQFQDSLISNDYFDLSKFTLIRGNSVHTDTYDPGFLRKFDLVILFPSVSGSDSSAIIEKCKEAGVTAMQYSQGDEQPLRNVLSGINAQSYAPQEISELSPNKITVKVTTKAQSFLVLSEVVYQGWKAYVDGREVPIMSAYSVLRAVYIDTPGQHEVSFIYEPLSFTIGVLITLTSPLMIVMVAKWGPRLVGNLAHRRLGRLTHTKHCIHCGQQLHENGRFCDRCGRDQVVTRS